MKADVVLLVDGSISVSLYGFLETGDEDYYRKYLVKALVNLVSEFGISKDLVHMSILFFGDRDIQKKIIDRVYIAFPFFIVLLQIASHDGLRE